MQLLILILTIILSSYSVEASITFDQDSGNTIIKIGVIGIAFIPLFLMSARSNKFGLLIVLVIFMLVFMAVAEDIKIACQCTYATNTLTCTNEQFKLLFDAVKAEYSKLQSHLKVCDNDGYCVRDNGEFVQLSREDCLDIVNLTNLEIYCATVPRSTQCSFTDQTQKERILKIPYCVQLEYDDYQLSNIDELWFSKMVKSIMTKDKKIQKKNAIVRLIDEVKRNNDKDRTLEDVIRFKIIYERLTSLIPSSMSIIEEQFLKGQVSSETVQTFKDDMDLSFSSGSFIKLLNKKSWSGFSLQKLLLIIIVTLIVYLVLMLYGPKAFKNYIGIYGIIAIFIAVLVMLL